MSSTDNNNQTQDESLNPADVLFAIYKSYRIAPENKQKFMAAAMRLSRDFPAKYNEIFASAQSFYDTWKSLPQLRQRLAEIESKSKK